MTGFDLLLVAILAISIVFAAVRGAVREGATLLAVGLAGAAAWMGSGPLLAAAGKSGSLFAVIAAAAGIGIVSFSALYYAMHLALRRVCLKGRARLADQIGGGVFGLVRALALIGLGFLGYDYSLDEEHRAEAVNSALLLPVAKASAGFFERFAPAPADLDPGAQPAPKPADDVSAPAAAARGAEAVGYGRADRAGLEEIIATVTSADEPVGRSAAQLPSSGKDEIADILVDSNAAPEPRKQP